MNYQTLFYFKTVAELQHYTKAAAKLFLTQPALTKSIQGLERELGVPLFKKDGRNVILTEYGKAFYPYATQAIESINNGTTAISQLLNTETDNIFMSCLHSAYSCFLPEKILAFRKIHPNCKFTIEYKFTSGILTDILEGHSELGISSSFIFEDTYNTDSTFSSLECKQLYQEPICFIAGKNNPLTKKKTVTMRELCDVPFIPYYKSKLGTNKIIYDICAKYGKVPNMDTEGYSDMGVFNLVAMNEGIAIVPDSGYFHNDQVVKLNVDADIPLFRAINLVWSKKGFISKTGIEFRDFLLKKPI